MMGKYFDVYLLPIPEENVEAYRKLAAKAGKIFVKNGALSYKECVASDLSVPDGLAAFPKTIKLNEGETLIYAAVEYRSEAHRNKSLKATFEDPALQSLMDPNEKPPFDMKRMVYGGFKAIVDL